MALRNNKNVEVVEASSDDPIDLSVPLEDGFEHLAEEEEAGPNFADDLPEAEPVEPKKPRVQTKAGRLGAAEKAVEKLKAKIAKFDENFNKQQGQRDALADQYEEAQRELGEALAAFGVTTTREEN